MVRLTDCPDMTLDVYHGCKTTIQQQQIAVPDFSMELHTFRINCISPFQEIFVLFI